MHDKAYRPCPICRTNLVEQPMSGRFKEAGRKWDIFDCPNCGSEIWIDPFKRVIERAK